MAFKQLGILLLVIVASEYHGSFYNLKTLLKVCVIFREERKKEIEIEISRFTDLHLHLVYIIRYEPCVSKVEWSQSSNILTI